MIIETILAGIGLSAVVVPTILSAQLNKQNASLKSRIAQLEKDALRLQSEYAQLKSKMDELLRGGPGSRSMPR